MTPRPRSAKALITKKKNKERLDLTCTIELSGDIMDPASELEKLESAEDEAMAKVLRLRKQRQLLKKRRKEMLRRGLRYLDKLDATKEKERKEAEERERATAATPSTVGFREVDLFALNDAFVLNFGET
ncbi:hypothetical protein EG329_008006 [Mollisiaceae sp. DMI_Dod_QoI]|nr:hypothetical protein EG329_008006 [Helotiales sp. DMI_Dod_QoI]